MKYKSEDKQALQKLTEDLIRAQPIETTLAAEILERIDLDHKVHINRALMVTGYIWLALLTIALAAG